MPSRRQSRQTGPLYLAIRFLDLPLSKVQFTARAFFLLYYIPLLYGRGSVSSSEPTRVSQRSYTLRRFGGRHPLCGIGVRSLIALTSIPTVARARTADSRPAPGPLTRTSTELSPY